MFLGRVRRFLKDTGGRGTRTRHSARRQKHQGGRSDGAPSRDPHSSTYADQLPSASPLTSPFVPATIHQLFFCSFGPDGMAHFPRHMRDKSPSYSLNPVTSEAKTDLRNKTVRIGVGVESGKQWYPDVQARWVSCALQSEGQVIMFSPSRQESGGSPHLIKRRGDTESSISTREGSQVAFPRYILQFRRVPRLLEVCVRKQRAHLAGDSPGHFSKAVKG